MKLFQAVKLIEDAGLTPELHSRSDGDVKVPLLLFGIRRWQREMRFSSVEERDLVVGVGVEVGGSIWKFDAVRIKDYLAEGMAKSMAREAAAKAAGDGRAA